MTVDTVLLFDADHPAFAGHFPGAPIVPGVLLLDAAIHALEAANGAVVHGVASAKFLLPVGPDQALAVVGASPTEGRAALEIQRGVERVAVAQLLFGSRTDS
jgi:3-hydroxyacyl-[acyl-carrier-protein] dehydratase